MLTARPSALALIGAASSLALVAGCGARLVYTWEPPGAMRAPPPQRYPKAAAVILKHEFYVESFVGRQDRHQVTQEHEVIAILTEAGLADAAVRIPIHDGEGLAAFQARTVTPDGQIHLLDASQVFKAQIVAGAATEKKSMQYRIFQFPKVAVGSVVEYMYAVESKSVSTYQRQRHHRNVPVEKYTVKLNYNGYLEAEAKAYNTTAVFIESKAGDSTTFTLEAGPLPAAPDEPSSPPPIETEFRWVSRIKGYRAPTQYFNWAANWPAAMEHAAKRYYLKGKEGVSAGAEAIRLDPGVVGRCGQNRACLVDKALAVTREKVELDTFDDDRPRKVADVVARGRGTNLEKAIVLRHLLDGAGVAAQCAFLTIGARGAVDRWMPFPGVFDHMVVYVPAQPGIAAPLWLDPSCEHCAAGEIPSWDVGAESLILYGEDHAFGAFDVKTQFEPVTGRSLLDTHVLRAHAVSLSELGDATVEEVERRDGTSAMLWRIERRKLSERELREKVERTISARIPSARVADHRQSCDRAAATCSETVAYTAPGYAALDGKRLAMPLSVFRAPSQPTRGADDERTTDVDFRANTTVDETITVRPPPGYVAVELPEPARVEERAISARFEATRDGDAVVLRRVLEERAGRYPRGEFARIRAVQRAFADYRRGLVVFAPR